MAFNSVEHIMRDVNNGWLIRYTHANVASFFFIFLYIHIARGLYYGSYARPRILLWSIGVIIFVLTMATGFLGYTLPWGQMSLWGQETDLLINLLPLIGTSMDKDWKDWGDERTEEARKPDKKFMAMFMGFVDGDGCIEIGPQKQYNKQTGEPNSKTTIRARLLINLHVKDEQLLKYFAKTLGVGKVTDLKAKHQKRFLISKRDLMGVVMPLIEEYNLEFLIFNRVKQYALLKEICNTGITQWEDVNKYPGVTPKHKTVSTLVKLEYFSDWVVGFTMAEGWFGFKSGINSAHYQIRQTGIENLNIIKAIGLKLTGREAYEIKPDKAKSYQLTISSKVEIKKVIEFFSSPSVHPLCGDKGIQYSKFIKDVSDRGII